MQACAGMTATVSRYAALSTMSTNSLRMAMAPGDMSAGQYAGALEP